MEQSKQLLHEGKADEAIIRLNQLIEENPTSDEGYYLRGNAYRKKGDWQQAINNYLCAMELNSESPAHQAYKIGIDILSFHHREQYNP